MHRALNTEPVPVSVPEHGAIKGDFLREFPFDADLAGAGHDVHGNRTTLWEPKTVALVLVHDRSIVRLREEHVRRSISWV
jgi:hypothetical protein